MKVAVVGSRNLKVDNLGKYLPDNVTELVSGGAKGIDSCAREYAQKKQIKLTEFLPEYNRYKKGAPLKRNEQIVDYADMVIAFWDSKSRGTKYTIAACQKLGKAIKIVLIQDGGDRL